MNIKKPHLKTLSMRKILLLTILSVFTTLSYGQCPNPPSAPAVDSNQYYCSAAAWMLIGEGVDNLSDLQIFPDQVGWSITWYADNAGVPGAVIAAPNTEVLVAGTSYHVTQTDAAGCESSPTKITVNERDCACIKDPTFEDQDGNASGRGYTAKQFPGINEHKTCGQSMTGAAVYPFGTTNGTNTGDDAVFVTPGMDPPYTNSGGTTLGTLPLQRTNPNNPASSHGFRIGRGVEYATAITGLEKKFIAGEVFVFNFALAVENPNHSYQDQPFAQVNLYDANDNLVQTRCLVSDPDDCIFIKTGTSGNVLYSEWSCMKMNTFQYMGQPLRAEFITAFCHPTQHFSYMYIDDLYVGDDGPDICGDSSFGYALLNSVTALGGECFIPEQTVAGTCASSVTASVPGFPLEVCGVYDAPISQGAPPILDEIKMNIIQNDVVVGTVSNPSPGNGPGTFCFTINETDINVLPYGEFRLEIEVDFELNCGAAYNFYIDDTSSANVCPRAGCPQELRVCDVDGTGISTFDLTVANTDLYNNQWDASDMTLTYYENEQDAHDETNPITNPTSYQNTVSGGQIIYIRIDWTVPGLTIDCYYIAELPLAINVLPDLTNLPDEYTGCGTEFEVTLSGVPANLPLLGDVTYQWFRDGVQLASSSSFYNASIPGVYTVIVSNFGCESTHTFTVVVIDYEIDLGQNEIVCDGSPVTITAELIPGPTTPPIDLSNATFLWNTGETTQTITVTQSGTYTVEVDYEGCIETKSKQVLIGDLEVELGEEIVLCDSSEGTILTAVVTGVPENEVTYLWSTGETTKTIEVTGFGTYSVDVSWNGCTATDSVTVRQADLPSISLGEDFQKCTSDEVTLEVIFLEPVTGNLTYTWFRDGGAITGTGSSITVTDFGTYSVIVDNEGCTSETQVTISQYASNPNCTISNGLSPEGSPGFNDYLDLEFLSIRTGIENLQIFNRLGRLVYEQQNYVNQWEGQSLDGDKLPTGTYYYVINLSGNDPVYGTQTSGWIYINRGIN